MFSIYLLFLLLIQASFSAETSNLVECGAAQSMAMSSKNCYKNNELMTRIVGGSPASISEFTWMASLFINNSGYCGTAIIHERWLITSAHCFPRTVDLNDVKVRIGNSDKLRGELMPIQRVVIHPEYVKTERIIYDIALIELKYQIHFNTSFANRVCSPPTNESFNRPELTVFAGWGQTSIDALKPTNLLMKSYFHTIPPNQCKYKTDRFICVHASQGMGCAGDSGSPLIKYNGCRAILLGTFSYAERDEPTSRCGPGLFIFIRLTKYLDWIQSLTGDLKWERASDNVEYHPTKPTKLTKSTKQMTGKLANGAPNAFILCANLFTFSIISIIYLVFEY